MTDSYPERLQSTENQTYSESKHPGRSFLADQSDAALIRLLQPETAPTRTTDRAHYCDECNRRVTIGTDGTTEFGHVRGTRGGDRCSRRPAAVDPTSPENRT